MGKKKSSQKPVKREKPKLDTIFNCPMCNSANSVTCEMDKDRMIGQVTCKDCRANFAADITPISDPIDVYCDWIDACETLNS